jgi:ribosomal protein S18 acetylase RimI-like enzyme
MQVLENIAWNTLAGPHAKYATGTNEARRYAPGFSPIIAFADIERPNFASLLSFCEPGEHFYCGGWSGSVPAGWKIDAETSMFKMVWNAPKPAAHEELDCVRLGIDHLPQILELVAITQPGPFGPRTVELGEYMGYFKGQRLVAMAGERMCAGALREISGVCTHPDYQGQGLARRLVENLIRKEMERNEIPFLHVMRDNLNARRIYEKMGFLDYEETTLRVLSLSH